MSKKDVSGEEAQEKLAKYIEDIEKKSRDKENYWDLYVRIIISLVIGALMGFSAGSWDGFIIGALLVFAFINILYFNRPLD